ncbi:hypothetical protein MASR1M45_10330 [Candidatus Kapaibacterium sp.]
MSIRKNKFFGLYLLIFISTITVAYSNLVTSSISNDTNNVMIGEFVKLDLNVTAGKNVKINFPIISDTIGKIEILEISPVDTTYTDGKLNYKKRLVVTSYEAGKFDIPEFVITYNIDNDTNFRVSLTNSLSLSFSTFDIDTANTDIKDIKPPIQVPFTLEDLLPYLIAAISIALIYLFIVYMFGKTKVKIQETIPKYDPRIPADLEAIEQLNRLEKENLWQNGYYKIYHSRLTDILRVYIHRRYHLNALEMTSNELINELNNLESNIVAINSINEILTVADLAKFAKFEPSIVQNQDSMKNAYGFINLTKVVDIEFENSTEISKEL